MIKEVISNDYDISENSIKVFANIVLNIKKILIENFETAIEYETENPVKNAINKFKNYPSMKLIISKIKLCKRCSIWPVSYNGILKQIKNLDTKRSNTTKTRSQQYCYEKKCLFTNFSP